MRITDGGRRTTDDRRRLPLSVFHSPTSAVHLLLSLLALAPLLVFAARASIGELTVNPIQEALQISGRTALNLLAASLVITPAAHLLRTPRLLPLRRTLGLWAFAWAALHMAVFAIVDFGLDWGMIAREFAEKAYLMAGALALVILIPLAVTSTRFWQRRLGARWKMLHRGVYLAATLALLHYWAALKPDLNDALLIYAPLLALLLLLRIPAIRRRI
jgi:sulfoxide reductase heme-binding subunit YedZ